MKELCTFHEREFETGCSTFVLHDQKSIVTGVWCSHMVIETKETNDLLQMIGMKPMSNLSHVAWHLRSWLEIVGNYYVPDGIRRTSAHWWRLYIHWNLSWRQWQRCAFSFYTDVQGTYWNVLRYVHCEIASLRRTDTRVLIDSIIPIYNKDQAQLFSSIASSFWTSYMSNCLSKCHASVEGDNLKFKVWRKTREHNPGSGDGKTTQFQSHINTCHDVIDVEDLMILDVSSYRKKNSIIGMSSVLIHTQIHMKRTWFHTWNCSPNARMIFWFLGEFH